MKIALFSKTFQGDQKITFVGFIFLIAGILILLLPFLLTVIVDPASSSAGSLNDANILLYILGGYFTFLGGLTLFLHSRKIPNLTTEVIIGAIAALTYAAIALVMPVILYLAFLSRPNFFFPDPITEFPTEDFWIGLIFFGTGLITFVAVILLIRHFLKTGSNSVSIRF